MNERKCVKRVKMSSDGIGHCGTYDLFLEEGAELPEDWVDVGSEQK